MLIAPDQTIELIRFISSEEVEIMRGGYKVYCIDRGASSDTGAGRELA